MKPFFSAIGTNLAGSLAFTKSIYAFDFDGTLAPIVSNPDLAAANSRILDQLRALSELASVLIVSGRSTADLRSRIPLKNVHLIGNHGLEGIKKCGNMNHRAFRICRRWADELKHEMNISAIGVSVEDKGYSIAMHYRNSRKKRIARSLIFRTAELLTPRPRLVAGKCVVNLIPCGAPHKGIALIDAMAHLGASSALYIGDDDTDEDVFSLPGHKIVSVRVGNRRGSQAQFYINRQPDVLRLIKMLVENEKNK